MKRILGLDLGTNSIGWALIEVLKNGTKRIIKLGSRIVSMDGAEMSNYKKGLPQTKNAAKREKKGIRVGNKRYKQRRNKLIYILQKLDMLPEQIKLSHPFDNPIKIQKINVLPIEKNTEQLTAREFMELRVKAIHEQVSLKELGKILYRFNQLRGYAGGDDEDMQDELDDVLGIKSDKKFPSQESRIQTFKILEYLVTDEEKKKKKIFRLKVIDEEKNEWEGTTIVENIAIDDAIELKQIIRRNIKTGEITSTEFSIPNKTGWRKKMENLEDSLNKHSEEKGRRTYLSEYFLDCLNENKWQKIRNNVILRSRYLEEFDAILETQKVHFEEIQVETVKEIAGFLFPGKKETQIALRKEAVEKGLKHIIRNQIIYYQRELKDQSHLISECRFEKGEKAVANSHPLFQEYRLWEQINKLSINRRTEEGIRKNGKPRYLYQERAVSSEFKEFLFGQLQNKKELTFSTVFKKLKEIDDFIDGRDFFNGLGSKSKLVGNTTRNTLKTRLGKFWDILNLENIDNQIGLWQLLYNGKGSEYDLKSPRNKAIAEYLKRKEVNDPDFDKIVIAISKIKFPRNYQSVSLKAVEKALPLVRAGKYFDNKSFSDDLNAKIIKILNEEPSNAFEETLEIYLYNNENEKLIKGGFGNAHALMLVYGQHTAREISSKEVFESYNEIKALDRHSLRNPLVEQMINETLVVVKDIWRSYGKPDEIKVELARELKNSIKERKSLYESNEESRKENTRIKERLRELKEELSTGNIEKYKLWKKQRNTSVEFLDKLEATKSEVEKMKLWDEQGYVDPYTGKPITLSQLFNKGLYDVDHIIPQSRYFDDSLGNKVVCATAVNRDKGNRTAMEYFEAGSTKCGLLSKEVFMDNAVKKFFGKKRRLMLATKIPDNPIERQKKETQYIAVKAKEELAKIVGSKNIKTSTGGVTHYLRNHWGITTVFKNLLKERFVDFFELKGQIEYERIQKDKEETFDRFLTQLVKNNLPEEHQNDLLNEIGQLEQSITEIKFKKLYLKCHIYKKDNNLIIKGYSKRFDHRHHAMDALIVACTDEKAVKRLNDLNQHLQDWLKENVNQFDIDLRADDENLLENFLGMEDDVRKRVLKDIEKFRNVEEPWKGFQEDAKRALSKILVSHKPKDKILIQQKEEKDKNGKLRKTEEKMIRIRGSLHEETIYGISSNAESYRIPLTKFAGSQFDTVGNIEKIANEYLRSVISDHFVNTHHKNKSEAFGAEGIMGLNKRLSEKIKIKNGKKTPAPHPPISSVKIYRKKLKDGKVQDISLQKLDREKSYNQSLYVNTGSNYLFTVLDKGDGGNDYDLISLFDAVALVKGEFNSVINNDNFDKAKVFKENFEKKNSSRVLFTLKQLDMVYFPGENEDVILDVGSPLFKEYWDSLERLKNIYTVTKFSGKRIYFLPHTTAEVIEKKIELGSQNMLEFYKGRKIVEYCLPVTLDRLGNIISVMDRKGNFIKLEND